MPTVESCLHQNLHFGPARVLIVKMDRFYAQALARLAQEAFPEAKLWVCHSGAEALAALRHTRAEFALVGLGLPDIDGLDLILQVLNERLVDRLLVVSTRNDEHSRQVLRHARVAGIFDATIDRDENLAAAIQRVGAGRTYFSSSGLTNPPPSHPPLNQVLSDAELRVLARIGDGATDEEAASYFGLSAATIHTHRQRIMRKLGVQCRTALMRAAIERGVIRFSSGKVFHPGLEQTLAERSPAARPHAPQAGAPRSERIATSSI